MHVWAQTHTFLSKNESHPLHSNHFCKLIPSNRAISWHPHGTRSVDLARENEIVQSWLHVKSGSNSIKKPCMTEDKKREECYHRSFIIYQNHLAAPSKIPLTYMSSSQHLVPLILVFLVIPHHTLPASQSAGRYYLFSSLHPSRPIQYVGFLYIPFCLHPQHWESCRKELWKTSWRRSGRRPPTSSPFSQGQVGPQQLDSLSLKYSSP